MSALRSLFIAGALAGLSSCGGGGDGTTSLGNSGNNGSSSGYQAGVYPGASTYEAKCAVPRTGNDSSGQPWPDTQGTAFDEKMWLRSWTNDLYLWYSEVPDEDPANYDTVASYFDILKTPATTATNHDKDRFHFALDTDYWISLSQSGVSPGYGLTWSLISSTPPRVVVAAYIEPSTSSFTSPAANAGLTRGARVVAVDNVSIDDNTETGVATLNAGLFPDSAGETHSFTIQDRGSSTTHTVTLQTTNVTSTPVQNVKTIPFGNSIIGYMLFNDHIATAEAQLVKAINTLKAANINDLVLDIRYNGGGYLDIASELAYMIGGSNTTGKTFEKLQFNSKHPTFDPVTGQLIQPVDFHSTGQGFSVTEGQTLPTLNLTRVFVLTGPDTCSASESVMNSLMGADVQVIQIGSTTCGKPYGFYPADNCSTTYFSIQFRGINNKGFGEYPDGFSPANTPTDVGVTVPGCSVADDFSHELGDANEARLAEALQYRLNGSCSVSPSGVSAKQKASVTSESSALSGLSAVDGVVNKAPFLENRILRKR